MKKDLMVYAVAMMLAVGCSSLKTNVLDELKTGADYLNKEYTDIACNHACKKGEECVDTTQGPYYQGQVHTFACMNAEQKQRWMEQPKAL